MELLLLPAVEPPSAATCSTAEVSKAGFVVGENVELFRRLTRWVPETEPREAV